MDSDLGRLSRSLSVATTFSGPMLIDLVWALLVFVGTGLAIMPSVRFLGVMGKY